MLDQIYHDIMTAYGAIDHPNWYFVGQRFEKAPYKEVVERMRRIAKVDETTDLNDDYCRVLSLTKNGLEFTVRLSLVGRYACIHDKNGAFLSASDFTTDSFGSLILGILLAEKFILLDFATLRIPFVLGNVSQPLYAVLFSSDGLIEDESKESKGPGSI